MSNVNYFQVSRMALGAWLKPLLYHVLTVSRVVILIAFFHLTDTAAPVMVKFFSVLVANVVDTGERTANISGCWFAVCNFLHGGCFFQQGCDLGQWYWLDQIHPRWKNGSSLGAEHWLELQYTRCRRQRQG